MIAGLSGGSLAERGGAADPAAAAIGMGIVWDRRIRHTSRPVKPTRLGNLRGRMRKAEVKARRGRPSGNLPSDLVFKRIALRAQLRLGLRQAVDALARLDLEIMRYRITERRRAKREAAQRRRRPRTESTIINLWRRRRDWLLKVEGAESECIQTQRTTITPRGQITLNKEVLRHLGVAPGARVEVSLLPEGRAELRAAPGASSRG